MRRAWGHPGSRRHATARQSRGGASAHPTLAGEAPSVSGWRGCGQHAPRSAAKSSRGPIPGAQARPRGRRRAIAGSQQGRCGETRVLARRHRAAHRRAAGVVRPERHDRTRARPSRSVFHSVACLWLSGTRSPPSRRRSSSPSAAREPLPGARAAPSVSSGLTRCGTCAWCHKYCVPNHPLIRNAVLSMHQVSREAGPAAR
jgi:hypothetical protein